MEMTRHGGATALEAVARQDERARALPQPRKDLFVAVARIETARERRFVPVRAKESCQGNLRRTWASRERP